MSQRMFPESRRFQLFRYGTAIIVMLLYLSYLSYLLTQVAKDAPLVQISYEYVNKLNIPDIEVCGSWSNVEITRCTFTWDDWSSTTSEDCSALLSPKARVIDNTYCYLYVGNDTYFYGNTATNPEGPWIRTIDFYFKINNITEITSRYLSVGTITIQLLDPHFNPFWRGSPIITGTDKRIKQELQLTNGFAGIQNMSTAVYFKKTIFRTILPYDISSILGGNPSYSNTTYLTTTSKDFPMHPVPPNANFTDTGHFSIAPGSFILEVKSEKRAHTVIGILGLAGGAFGLTVGIYVVLFGRKRSNPWGLMHRMMKFEINDTNLQNSSELPFVSTFDPIQNHRIPIEQRITRLEVRILNLEMILKDYVFDPSALKRMVKRQKLNEVNEICLNSCPGEK